VIEQQYDRTGKRWDRPGIIAVLRKLPVSPGAAIDAPACGRSRLVRSVAYSRR